MKQSGSPKPYQYVAIRVDITARKAAEERLAQLAALARVGQMAAVVAHEVRNPLAGIKGAIQVMMSRRQPPDPELPVMRDVVARSDALGDLINDLMVFARPRPPHPSTFDLRPLLLEAISMLRRDPAGEYHRGARPHADRRSRPDQGHRVEPAPQRRAGDGRARPDRDHDGAARHAVRP